MAAHRYQWNNGPDADQEEDRVSRSRRKRESSALQEVGEKLAALSPSAQKALPLPPELRDALAELRRISNREARRRHLQYIGRLMREVEAEGLLEDILEAWAALK